MTLFEKHSSECIAANNKFNNIFIQSVKKCQKEKMNEHICLSFFKVGFTFSSFHFSGNDLVLMLRLQI